MIERYTRDFLRDVTAIRDRVDEGTDLLGVYCGTVPHGHRGECILLTDITAEHYYHLGGEVSPRSSVVQITCYSDKAGRAYSLAELVRNRLSGYGGLMGDSDETRVLTATIVGSAGAEIETPEDASDKFIYSYTRDYELIYTTTVPTLT
jgi:hypothetical protein